jgi:predicted tellurium resistance membrane protein TerC
VGLALAMLTRIALLFSIVWLTRLTTPWFSLGAQTVSGRDLILFVGGVFLVVKSIIEIRHSLHGAAQAQQARALASFFATVVQIAIIDIVFSLDSVFTAVGLARDLPIMVAAIVVAIAVMMWLAGGISAFIERHPTVKMLALAFLVLIGAALMAEGAHYEVSKGYLYFAMAFSVIVEILNIRLRKLLDSREPRPLQ